MSEVHGAQGKSQEFTGPRIPVQVRIPADLAQALKLHAVDRNCSISDLVVSCLTSQETVTRIWVSRKAG